jgi:creatinine amidohydrolase
LEVGVRFEDLNWYDIKQYLEQDNRLIFVLGACEQHAYLSLLTDVKIPLALADAASELTGVLIAPPLNFGSSPYFLAYPGTLSLRVTTLLDIIEDLIRSIYQQGFRRILILNGHGGNEPARGRLYELVNQLPDLHLAWYSWWLAHSVQQVAQKWAVKPLHANWLEAFDFTRVTELPEEDKKPPYVNGLLGSEQAQLVYGDGSFGGPYKVDNEIMQEVFQVALDDILTMLQFS